MSHKASKVAVGLILLLLVSAAAVPVTTLSLSSPDGRETLLIPLPFERPFVMEYKHSVQKTPVLEHFAPAPGNRILLEATTYYSLGVGLPFLGEEGRLVLDGEKMVFHDMNRYYNTISFIFDPLAEHSIICGDRRYELNHYFRPETVVTLEIRKYTPIQIILQYS